MEGRSYGITPHSGQDGYIAPVCVSVCLSVSGEHMIAALAIEPNSCGVSRPKNTARLGVGGFHPCLPRSQSHISHISTHAASSYITSSKVIEAFEAASQI